MFEIAPKIAPQAEATRSAVNAHVVNFNPFEINLIGPSIGSGRLVFLSR